MRHSKDLGDRKHHRIQFHKPAFIIVTPDATWIDCVILDISAGGVRLGVDALPVKNVFGLAFDPAGHVRRVCSVVWRRGDFVGARFLTAKELQECDTQNRDGKT